MGEHAKDVAPAQHFILRTPLLPLSAYRAWSEGLAAPSCLGDLNALEKAIRDDRARLHRRLLAWVNTPSIREALFVASPSLLDDLSVWIADPESEHGDKITRALVRYLARMCSRPTPFGLCAACSIGEVGSEAHFEVGSLSSCRRHARIDAGRLAEVGASIAALAEVAPTLRVFANATVHRSAGQLRYARSRPGPHGRELAFVARPYDPLIDKALRSAGGGAALSDVAATLVNDAFSDDAARKFLVGLLRDELLFSEVYPAASGPEPIYQLLDALKRSSAVPHVTEQLAEVARSLRRLDSLPLGAPQADYRSIENHVRRLPGGGEVRFHVDLFRGGNPCLSTEVVDEILRGVEVVVGLRRVADEPLARFAQRFVECYGGGGAPLLEALEELGADFETWSDARSSLLAGLPVSWDTGERGNGAREDGRIAQALNRVLRAGSREIVLDAEHLRGVTDCRRVALPEAFSVTGTVIAGSAQAIQSGEFRVELKRLQGPPGALRLARFCHDDARIEALVRSHIAMEPAADDAIVAEIAHVPDPSLADIICRPVFREHEIVVYGRSSLPPERQIPVSDLWVCVIDGQIALISKRLGRRVIPRLSSAHNYVWRSLGLYRFLGLLQQQEDLSNCRWDWGECRGAQFLPRVVVGRVVLSRARWSIHGRRAQALWKSSASRRFAEVQRIRGEMELPRWVCLEEPFTDNELLIDFENTLSVDSFIHASKERETVCLSEPSCGEDDLCVASPDGYLTHEFVLPFSRRSAARRISSKALNRSLDRQCRFAPGSEWLYAKLYCSPMAADQVLAHVVAPTVRRACASGACDRWHFLRYADPDAHLRLRMRGDSSMLWRDVPPLLNDLARPLLEDGGMSSIVLDTYAPETVRYGGLAGLDLVERIFHADSEAVLSILTTNTQPIDDDTRWRLTLRGMDLLLGDLGLDLPSRQRVVTARRDVLFAELGVSGMVRGAISRKFRSERHVLECLVNSDHGADALRISAQSARLDERSRWVRSWMPEFSPFFEREGLSFSVEELGTRCLHLHVNRMLRAPSRAEEAVLCDFLVRLYGSRIAHDRSRRQPG